MQYPNCSIYDAKTGRRLRDATREEVDAYYCSDSKPFDGTLLGFPGQQVWVDITRPTRRLIAAWFVKGRKKLPVFSDWEYRAETNEEETLVSGKVAAAYARAHAHGKLVDGRIPGGRYGFPGQRLRVLIDDHYNDALPPDPVLRAWYKEMGAR